MSATWVGFNRVDANKMSLCAQYLPEPSTCHCNLSSRAPSPVVIHNQSAAICCIACCLQKDLPMPRWNKRLLRYIMDFGKALYRRCIKTLRLKSNQYVSIDELVSCFYISDTKYCIKLEEALRGRLDPEIEDEREKFKCAIRGALATGDSYIITVERNNLALWSGDQVKTQLQMLSNPACTPPASSYLFDPQSSTGGTKDCTPIHKKGTPCLSRYTCMEYMLDDVLEIICGVGKKRRLYCLTKFSVTSRQSLERTPAENVELQYMHHHCKEAYLAVAQMLRGKRFSATQEDPGTDLDNLVARSSGYFLNPLKFSTKQDKACHCRQGDGVELKGQVFLQRSVPDCPEPPLQGEEDHGHFARPSDQSCLLLEGNKNLMYYKECENNQTLPVAIMALRKAGTRKASSWDRDTMDEILFLGSEMYMDYRKASCILQKRPTLLGLTRCVGGSDKWGGWSAKTAAWGRAPGLPALIGTVLASKGRGILQYPGKMEVSIWSEDESFYLFIPLSLEKEESPPRLLCFHSQSLLASALTELLPSAADVCVSRVDFKQRVDEEPLDNIEDDFRSLSGKEKQYPELRTGLPIAVGVVALATDEGMPSSVWEPENIDQIVNRGHELFEETMAQTNNGSPKEVCLYTLPKTFTLEDLGFAETEIIHDAVTGLMYCSSEKNDVPTLQQGFIKFFKDNRHGILTARGKTLTVWKGHDKYLFCLNHKMTELKNGIAGNFYLLRLINEEALAQYVEGDLPLSKEDSFSISAVNIQLLKINKNTGLVDLKLDGEFAWQPEMEGRVAILRSWECPRPFSECSLPVAIMFGCASCLLGPNRMTAHHLSSLVECGVELGKRLRSKHGKFDVTLAEHLLEDDVNFGIHAFSITFGPKKFLVFDRNANIDYDKKITENKTPGKYDASSLTSFLEAVFQWQHCQQLLLAVDRVLCLSLWRAWPGGPVALLHPEACLGLPPAEAPQALAEAVEEKPGKKNGKKGDKKKGGKKKGDKKKDVKNAEAAVETESGPSAGPMKGVVCVYLYPALSILAKHIGTILPYGFTEGRLTVYPLKVTTVSGAIVSSPEPPPLLPEEGEENPVLGKNLSLLGPGMWVLVGESSTDKGVVKISDRKELDYASAVIGIVIDSIEPCDHWEGPMLDVILQYGEQLFHAKIPGECEKRKPFTVATNFFISDFKVNLEIKTDVIIGDIRASEDEDIVSVSSGLNSFFGEHNWTHGILSSKNYIVGIWKMDEEQYSKYRFAKKTVDIRTTEALEKEELKKQRKEEARKLIEGESSTIVLSTKGSGEEVEETEETEENKKSENEQDLVPVEETESTESIESEEQAKIISQNQFFPDEFDIAPTNVYMVDVVKAAEVIMAPPKKPVKEKKGKPEKEVGKDKAGKGTVKPPLEIIPEALVEMGPPKETTVEKPKSVTPSEVTEEVKEAADGGGDKGDEGKSVQSTTSDKGTDEGKSLEAGEGVSDTVPSDQEPVSKDEEKEMEKEVEETGEEIVAESEEIAKDAEKPSEMLIIPETEKKDVLQEDLPVEESVMEILSIHSSIRSVMDRVLDDVEEIILEDDRLAEIIESEEFLFEGEKCIVFMWDPHGFCSEKIRMGYEKPSLVAFNNTKSLADFFVTNTLVLGQGSNRFTITGVKSTWRRKTLEERAASPRCPERAGVPESVSGCHKAEEAATAYIHTGGGRSYLVGTDRGCRCKLMAIKNSICWSIAAVVMRQLLDISLWSSAALDDINAVSMELKLASERKLGCDFIAKKGTLHPSQVIKDFLLEKKHVHFEIEEVFSQNVDACEDVLEKLRLALEAFFAGRDPLGILYTSLHGCAALWKSSSSSREFLAVNWPKEHVLMYKKPENLAIGYLTMISEMNPCATEVKLFKVYMTVKNSSPSVS